MRSRWKERSSEALEGKARGGEVPGIPMNNGPAHAVKLRRLAAAPRPYVMCQESGPTEVIESGHGNNRGTDSGAEGGRAQLGKQPFLKWREKGNSSEYLERRRLES